MALHIVCALTIHAASISSFEGQPLQSSRSRTQLALAWLLTRGDDIVPIPGSRSPKHLEENVAAIGIEMSPDDLARIDEAAPVGAAVGDRYPDMSRVNL